MNIKSNKGSITLYVSVAMLFLTIFIISIYITSSNKQQIQVEVEEQTTQLYNESNIEEKYNSYIGGDIIPIYTKDQLLKIGSGENIEIKEENGMIYKFASNKTYVLKNDIEFTGDWKPIGAQIQDGDIVCTFEGQGHIIKVTDLEGVAHIYEKSNGFK